MDRVKRIFRKQGEQALTGDREDERREESRILVPLTDIRQTKKRRFGAVMNLALDRLSLEVPMGHLNLSGISFMALHLA